MSVIKKTLIALMLVFINVLLPAADLLNQEKGVLQQASERQIQFTSFRSVPVDLDNVPLKRAVKILFHQNNLYILDSQRCELYVITLEGRWLRTIGRPGQGPGDMEYPSDFFIAPDKKIYILSSFSKRISVFSIEGRYISGFRLRNSNLYSLPDALMIDADQTIIIAEPLGDIVGRYGADGRFIAPLLTWRGTGSAGGKLLGLTGKLAPGPGNSIIHFDAFRGVFTKICANGEKTAFSSFNRESAVKLNAILSEKPGKVNNHSVMSFILWSDFCMDSQGVLYALPNPQSKESQPTLFAWSSNGVYLYQKPLDGIRNSIVLNITCDSERFAFFTRNVDLFIAEIKHKTR